VVDSRHVAWIREITLKEATGFLKKQLKGVDRAILDAVQVVGFFNYITKLADGLGVELEDFVRPWGGASG